MKTGLEHYLEAEKLLDFASKDVHENYKKQSWAAAQVHATLALASAVATLGIKNPPGSSAVVHPGADE